MKNSNVFIIIILVISLIMNFVLISKIDNLEDKVGSIYSYQNRLINDVNSQTNNVSRILNDMKEEQSWISGINMKIGNIEIKQGKANLSFDWQIKELKKNSKVVFNYKYGESEEFTTIDAIKENNGVFKVNIPTKVSLEPEWRIRLHDRSLSSNTREEKAIEEVELKEEEDKRRLYKQNKLSYFVTVSHDDTIKNSEINERHLGNLGTQYYGVLDGSIDIKNNKKYKVSVFVFAIEHGTGISIKEVYINKYNNGQLTNREKLVSNDKSTMLQKGASYVFHTKESDEEFDYTKLILEVNYSNGETFENIIYSK